ncbi:radical SAM family heme chaperone HemW [Candidatus Sulfidibacterium hydrothermale]|uniref:radical SAM family heme chaperone HemW n=1 Tax=Candidatus Sulfidibacterium hydrothermale TaxID=2875962 RepID=UPI001F0A084A|nr:radical SAM family heme chaperone HemW [Candidatus Sulfidibacterium hydrothermale]UBM62336.1 radical SAM family heme chaperone HemW [Candidatus Sulfidibacterium hydrothermale]
MSGIYIHIPFCKQKCHYCNFYSVASRRYRSVFVDALLNEMQWRKDYLPDKQIQTVYFGGGTPSLLTISEINQILDKIQDLFVLSPEAEITLEANPDDLSDDYLKQLKAETKINRLSIGVQSFFDDDLQYLHRSHHAAQAIKAIETAQKNGFRNLSIDLIYGIPTLTEEKWKQNLHRFFEWNIPHLSSYALTVEPRTALDVLIRQQKLTAVDEEQSIRQFNILLEQTEKRGYIQYEISNFALPGFYSKHNSAYWMGGHYLGLGPSAHSYNGFSRQWNVKNLKQYTQADTTERVIQEKEILTEEQRYNEYVLTALRTSWGCDVEHIRNGFGKRYEALFLRQIQHWIANGKVRKKGNAYILTEEGKLFADGIAADLFVDEE